MLKLQYFGHLMRMDNSLAKSLMLSKIKGRRRRGHPRMRWLDGRRRRGHPRMKWLDGITDAMNINFGKLQEMVSNRNAWHAAGNGVAKS